MWLCFRHLQVVKKLGQTKQSLVVQKWKKGFKNTQPFLAQSLENIIGSKPQKPVASVGIKFNHFSLTYNADYAFSHMNDRQYLSHQLSLRSVGKPNRFGKRLINL